MLLEARAHHARLATHVKQVHFRIDRLLDEAIKVALRSDAIDEQVDHAEEPPQSASLFPLQREQFHGFSSRSCILTEDLETRPIASYKQKRNVSSGKRAHDQPSRMTCRAENSDSLH
jgi:hypothetical protein